MLTWGVMGPDLPEHTVSISPFRWLEEDNALHGLSFPKPPSPFISSRLVHWRSNYWDLSASNQVHQTESSDWKERQTYQWGWINHSIVVKVKQGRNKETPNTTTSTKSEETIHIFSTTPQWSQFCSQKAHIFVYWIKYRILLLFWGHTKWGSPWIKCHNRPSKLKDICKAFHANTWEYAAHETL